VKEQRLNIVKKQIKTLESPFGYFNSNNNLIDEQYGFWDWFIMPKRCETAIVSKLVPQTGIMNLVWFYLYLFCVSCYFIITMILSFLRTDIFNLTITSVSVYYLGLMYIPNSF